MPRECDIAATLGSRLAAAAIDRTGRSIDRPAAISLAQHRHEAPHEPAHCRTPRSATPRRCCTPTPTRSRSARPACRSSSAARACGSTTRPGAAISRRWRGSGAAGSASASRAGRGGASRWSSCPTTTSSAGKSHEPAVELAEKIKALAPVPMARVIYQSSGSEANDTQIKLVWYYNNALGRPKKKKIIARKKGYHGVTIVSASLTGLPYNHKDFDLPVDRGSSTLRRITGRARAGRDRGRVRRPPAPAELVDTLIEREGAGHGRRLHRRAGDGRRRGHRAAGGLFRGDLAVCRRTTS
jgi:hypothetical protein